MAVRGNQPGYMRLLDADALSKMHRLELVARGIVEGFVSGRHKSPYKGFSAEFAEHREYTRGDDLRTLDWKVYGKTDRYYIKQYEEETNLKATFLVDVSESMCYQGQYGCDGGPALSKYHYAACTAASLALLLLNQQDAVGLATFDDALRTVVPPSANPNHIKTIVQALDTARTSEKTSLEPICHSLAEQVARRGLICLVSDLFTDLDGLQRGLQHFRHRQHEVLVLHVMDEDELTFPFQGNTMFRGLEAAGTLTVEPRALREGYLESVRAFCADVKRRCAVNQVEYKLVSTADNLGSALSSFLAAKAAAAKKASSRRR